MKKVANNAREQIRESAMRETTNRQFHQSSEELQGRKVSEDYFEDDTERLI